MLKYSIDYFDNNEWIHFGEQTLKVKSNFIGLYVNINDVDSQVVECYLDNNNYCISADDRLIHDDKIIETYSSIKTFSREIHLKGFKNIKIEKKAAFYAKILPYQMFQVGIKEKYLVFSNFEKKYKEVFFKEINKNEVVTLGQGDQMYCYHYLMSYDTEFRNCISLFYSQQNGQLIQLIDSIQKLRIQALI